MSAVGILIARAFILADDSRAVGAFATPNATASPTSVAIACGVINPGDQDFCRRYVDDVARRAPLTAEQRAAGLEVTIKATSAIESSRRAAPAMTVTELRDTLTAAGFADVMVRMARPADPAPIGSLIYAASSVQACLVGYVSGRSTAQLVGRLPGGACLAP